ncbi:hypothetical protein ACLQ24_11520 [Micromonospora sp. DT4]
MDLEVDSSAVRHRVEVDRWLAGLADSLTRIHPDAGPARRP